MHETRPQDFSFQIINQPPQFHFINPLAPMRREKRMDHFKRPMRGHADALRDRRARTRLAFADCLSRKNQANLVKAKVRVHRHPDGTLAVFHCPRKMADYTGAGDLIEIQPEMEAVA